MKGHKVAPTPWRLYVAITGISLCIYLLGYAHGEYSRYSVTLKTIEALHQSRERGGQAVSASVSVGSGSGSESLKRKFTSGAVDSDVKQPPDKLRGGGADMKEGAGQTGIRAISHHVGTGKDVVLGMAKGITPKALVVFLASLRKFSECDVVLWMDAKSVRDERNRNLVKKHGVEVIEFSKETEPLIAKWHPSSYRWVFMHQFLQSEGVARKYRGVLFVDVRDTSFQADPFSILELGAGFYTSTEDSDTPKHNIKNCGWNGGWVKSCYGQTVLSQVGDNPIVCSGVSISTLDEALIYAKKLNDKLMSEKGQECERNGVDQGMHNVLVWTNEIPNLKLMTQESGLIANMQSKLYVAKGSRVENKKGQVMPIMHQYDRNVDILRALHAEYVNWIVDDDKLCERFNTEDKGIDYFAGRCDMGLTGGAMSKGDCCRACDYKAGCKAFAFSKNDAKCYLKNCNSPVYGKRESLLRGSGTTGWLKD